MLVTDDRDQRRVSGKIQVGHTKPRGGRAIGERHLDETRLSALELEQPDQGAHADGLLDQGSDEMWSGDGDVDSPGLVEHPFVLGVVHPCDDPWNPELLLCQQRDHQVVLVVARDRGNHIGGRKIHRRQRRKLTRIDHLEVDAPVLARGDGSLDDGLDLFENQHVMSRRTQVRCDVQPDVAAAGDDHPHQ